MMSAVSRRSSRSSREPHTVLAGQRKIYEGHVGGTLLHCRDGLGRVGHGGMGGN